ncbi:MAG TPA: tetratricopeptide repeat protein [Flavobacteriaceae bacterium]|nr:tetratricopeptide repeat protein [Flavobacteriaceae bacterium]
MKQLFLIVFFTLTTSLFSQSKLELLNDRAMDFYKENPQKALAMLDSILGVYTIDDFPVEQARTINNKGIVFRDLGELEKAKAFSQKALSVTNEVHVKASAYNNIGACNRVLGNYEEALTAYLEALKIYESLNSTEKQATVNNNIGMVYSYLGIVDKAVEFHLKAKDIFEKEQNKKGMSEAYNNLAIVYANEGDLQKALDYFKYSLKLEEELNSKKGIAESTNNVGAVFYYLQEIDSALVYFNKSVDAEKSIGNLAGVGTTYNNIADVLMENGRLSEAKKYLDSAHVYVNKSKVTVDMEMSLQNYSRYYELKGDKDKALEYFKNYSKFRDSTLNLETNSKIAELEIQYNTEKNEKEILSQKAELAEKELHLNRKNTYIFGLIILAVVVALLGALLYNQQKLKNAQLKKENQLKDALLKIETQNRLQEQRLRISRDLHDNIGAQLTFIISSLDSLKYGFTLPEKLSDKLSKIGIFTKSTITDLRDTIWAMNKNEISFEDLRSRISNFIEKADLSTQHIDFSFHVEEQLKQTQFSSVTGMNIYRIVQEAINNAVKYAEASTIKVEAKTYGESMQFQVEDNGKGFNLDHVEYGNGFHNMKKRAEEIGAKLDIQSQEAAGTSITLLL